jgi:hypothetical protein
MTYLLPTALRHMAWFLTTTSLPRHTKTHKPEVPCKYHNAAELWRHAPSWGFQAARLNAGPNPRTLVDIIREQQDAAHDDHSQWGTRDWPDITFPRLITDLQGRFNFGLGAELVGTNIRGLFSLGIITVPFAWECAKVYPPSRCLTPNWSSHQNSMQMVHTYINTSFVYWQCIVITANSNASKGEMPDTKDLVLAKVQQLITLESYRHENMWAKDLQMVMEQRHMMIEAWRMSMMMIWK